MSAHERVMATLQGQPTDRVPVFAVLSTYGAKLTGADLRTHYSDAATYVAGQRAVEQTFGLDLVLAPFDYSALGEAFGGEVAWFADQAPNLKRFAARTAAEALALPLPDPRRTGRLPVTLDSLQQLAALYRGRVPVFAAIPGPGALPAVILGLETWLETVLFDEPAAARILEWSGRFFVAWANALLDAGATALVVTEPVAAAEIMPRRLFAERFLPHLRTQLAQVRGPVVLHHTGGRIAHVLDLLPGLPGLAGVVIGSKDDLGAARTALGPELLLLGNLDNLSLPTASAAELREQSLTCLRTAAPSGRYILSHSAADVPLATPPENIHAMRRASEEYAGAVAAGLRPAVVCGILAAPTLRQDRSAAAGGRSPRQAGTPAATAPAATPPSHAAALTAGFHFRGRLPPIKREGAAYFVTFRLADSLPAEAVARFKHERDSLVADALAHQRPLSWQEEQQLRALYSDKMESLLDAGEGSCCLRQPEMGELVATALKYFDCQRYDLQAWVVMPNHVHVIVQPHPGHTLSEILHSWKSYTAKQANRLLGRGHESFWQTESYDHWIRDDREHAHFVAYIEANPVKAGLCSRPEDWRWSSAAVAAGLRPAVARGIPAAPTVEAGILPAVVCGIPAAPTLRQDRSDAAGGRSPRQARTPAATPIPPPATTVWLSCGVLRAELEALQRTGQLHGELRFLDSMLHMAPPRLQTELETALGQPGPAGGRLVLVYGDCCGRMLNLVREHRVGRVNAINCAQMLVGRARYRELMHAQAFLLLPEWAQRWREIMRVELGLSPEVARDLMREHRREIVYLDTALMPVPHTALAECAAYTGLPCRIEPVPLDHLLALLLEAESAAVVRPLPEVAS